MFGLVRAATRGYKCCVKIRGYKWHLTDEYARELIHGACYYCAVIHYPVNGIDRADNTRGHGRTCCELLCYL